MNFAIIIPSLNPDEKMVNVVRGMYEAGFKNIVLVDDGSDEDHKWAFEGARSIAACPVLVHEVNKGKGQALKTAFRYVMENMPGVDAVITIDGDGQHTPSDAVKLAEGLEKEPDKVMMGCRDFKGSHVPVRNLLGNKITSGVFRFMCGIKLSDTQTGLRGIPSKYLKEFCDKVEGDRFEYETNMLLYMKKRGIEFREIPIATLYIEENKSSHFDPVRDSIKIYGPILRFAIGSGMSMIIDLGLYSLFSLAVFSGLSGGNLKIALSTVCARVISSLFNYTYNKKAVFYQKGNIKKSMARYYTLAAIQLAASALLVTIFVGITGAEGLGETLVKGCVDLFLFFISYFVQRVWVFKD